MKSITLMLAIVSFASLSANIMIIPQDTPWYMQQPNQAYYDHLNRMNMQAAQTEYMRQIAEAQRQMLLMQQQRHYNGW